ncbi:xanthine dehydrogenase family protein molybdopterin-binding subunit [Amycolatopsis anabasis]|uniref:xanthine dehydrogenase family protein molybdopterin-binding subunit n=1 Tax=Amycolatopsis anabasis TaxID=1840409 RepID=UPI00131E675D|nr:xanthine dehydrogenase family protein molybdopterin-binding subunit [Amycolatopsis anabasis]
MTTGLFRPDGPAKLTGAATYAGDTPKPDALHAALVLSTVPLGRLAAVDVPAVDGVHAVFTHENLPRLNRMPMPPLGHTVLGLRDDEIHFEGQPIAIVLADTPQRAQHAAERTTARYVDVAEPLAFADAGETRQETGVWVPVDYGGGDVDAGLAAADAVVSQRYTTSDRHANPIEPWSVLAWWSGDGLVVHASVQTITMTQRTLAELFGLRPEQVRVVSPFVGGGFGSKAWMWPPIPLAAAAAKAAGRPVKLVLTRAQMFTLCGHQPATRQTVSVGATGDGRLTAFRQHFTAATARFDGYLEGGTGPLSWLYDCPAIETRVRAGLTDRPNPTPMRAPAEGIGLFGVECALDELAYRLDLDPVELRLRNEPPVEPLTGKPFSSRKLVECLREGARRFGWADRDPSPRSMRDGDEFVGWGMAVATRETVRAASAARLRVHADGRVVVETGLQEIGTGMPALVRAVVAEALEVAPGQVELRHGDSTLPEASPSIGSMSAMSVGAAVRAAADEVREKLAAVGGLAGLRDAGLDTVEVEGRWDPPEGEDEYSTKSYGAIFAEVRVDADLGLVRMPRAVGVFAAGRILNPATAHSQLTGGMIWGYGQALLERSVLDRGRFLAKNLAGYVVPVNADIGDLDVSFVDEFDEHASPLGAKGVGELGAIGVAPAIANAVFHATGKRVRGLPIRIEDLLTTSAR